MSIRKTMDKAMTAMENGTTGIKRFYKFMKGLSFKSKANVDLQIKSGKRLSPLCRCGFSCDKEIRILPILYGVIGVAFLMMILCSSKDRCDD